VISIDTKKKELVGDYKNAGSDCRPEGCPDKVKVHDFIDAELGLAPSRNVPFWPRGLAMLARKGALRVAPGGSSPLFPSAPHHGLTISGRDEKAGSSAEPESWIVGARPGGRGDISILENQGTFLFCVEIRA
jgi:hypothetical protein